MMNKIKKLTSYLLTMAMVVSLIPTIIMPVIAEETDLELNIATETILLYEIDGELVCYQNRVKYVYSGNLTVIGDPDEPSAYTIKVISGTHNITLNNVNIEGSTLDVRETSNLTITLVGENTINADSDAGIRVPDGATLTIRGEGSLTVTGGSNGAGIGGDTLNGLSTGYGTINIESGTIIASGDGAGIGSDGSGFTGTNGTINISGGTITATGGSASAGIGGGYLNSGGTINITGGTIIATGSSGGAGIGSGWYSDTGATINISGGTITATGEENAAGIGGGSNSAGCTITIEDGIIEAIGGEQAAGIGGGKTSDGGTITILGGTVTANGGQDGAGIGGGYQRSGGTITILGGTVTATGGYNGAGIGGGYDGDGGTINIEDGTVIADGGYEAAGIGGGVSGDGGIITITGGTVDATAGTYAAAIGSGKGGNGGVITISGGTVTAIGGNFYSGIGYSQNGGSSGTFTTGENGNAFIITTSMNNTSDQESWSGVIFINDSGTIYGSPTIETDATIPEGKTLEVSETQTLTVGSGTTFINDGTINNVGNIQNNGVLDNTNGIINNTGTLDNSNGEFIGDILGNGGYVSSSKTEITSFEISGQVGTSTIDTATYTIEVIMPYGSDVTQLSPTITISEGATISPISGEVKDFINVVTYTVTAEDGTTAQDWQVTVITEKNTETEITAFEISGQVGSSIIDTTNHTVEVTMPYGSDVTKLSPTITLSDGAIVDPTSGEESDFTNTVTYEVTAEDGITIQNWEVTIIVEKNTETEITAFEISGQEGTSTIDTINHTIEVTIPYGSDITKLSPTITLSGGATVDPESGEELDFTNTVTYEVTAEDGTTTQEWEVTVLVAANPDIATVDTAFENVESATYSSPTNESDYVDESALESYVKSIAEAAINDDTVSVTVNKISYTPEVDGTKLDKVGTDGSYVFTITVSKGTENSTTTQMTMTIPATQYGVYSVIEGNNQTFTVGTDGIIIFKIDGEFSKFIELYLNEILVDEDDYIAIAGSVIIALKANYVQSLSVGSHVFTAVFTDGEATANMEVEAEEVTLPSTDEEITGNLETELDEDISTSTDKDITDNLETESDEDISTSTDSEDKDSVVTSDNSVIWIYVILLFVSLGGVGYTVSKRKSKDKQED